MFYNHPSYNLLVLDALTYAGNLNNIPQYIKDAPRFEFWYGSITNQDLVDSLMKRSDMVVHFAAESHVGRSIFDNKTFIATDVMGTQVLMDSLVEHKNVKRFIHISTSEVYGTTEDVVMDENHALNPRSPYAAAKAGADRLVYSYCCTYDVPTVIIRPFNNFGPNQHLEKGIPRFITSLINNKPITIHGEGHSQRDWVYVGDVCQALDKLLHIEDFQTVKHQIINLGSGKPISVLEIAHLLLEYFNLPQNYLKFVEDRPGQVACHVSCTKKAEKLLNWKVTRNLQETLPEVVEWYKNNKDWWKNLEIMQTVPVITKSQKVEMQ